VLNTDAHAKNYSIQILPEQTTLSPLYDLSSLLPYIGPDDPDARRRDIAETRLALTLVDDYRVSALTRFEWEGAARDAAIPPAEFLEWGIELNRALPSAIDAAVDSIPAGIDPTIATRLSDAIRSRSLEVGRILARRRA
jgi:serine/threonine-protein kinase HipA